MPSKGNIEGGRGGVRTVLGKGGVAGIWAHLGKRKMIIGCELWNVEFEDATSSKCENVTCHMSGGLTRP